METNQARIERERRFWDERARTNLGAEAELYRVGADDRYDRTVPWLPYLGMPAHVQRLLDAVGDVRGRSVLDLGCGTGFLTALLAARGASVDAVDVSEQSLSVAAERAQLSGIADAVRCHNMSGEALEFPDASFDRVVGLFVLHHLDLAHSAAEIHRVLRPGGVAAFVETWGRNRLLMAARRGLTGRFGIEKAGSPDEAPLGRAAERILENSGFATVEYAFADMLCFRMGCYLPWARWQPLATGLLGLDTALFMLPWLRRYSYFCVVILRKAEARAGIAE